MADWLQRRFSHVVLLLAGYFLLNMAVRLVLPASLELDEAQQMFYTQWLAAGYDSQPPLYNWLQYGVFWLIGPSVLALTLTKNVLLFATYLFYGLTARRLLGQSGLVAAAILGLITIPQIGFEAQRDLTHTVAVLFSASLFIYALVRTLQTPSLFAYALTGLALGLGAMSKYNFALMPVAALAALMFDARMRVRVFDPRLVLTIVVAVLVVSPHALWLKDNLALASARTITKMMGGADESWFSQVSQGLLSLAMAILAFSIVTLVLFGVSFRRALARSLSSGDEWTALLERMFAVFLLGLIALIVFAGAENIKDRWLTPLLFLLPLYLSLKLSASKAEIGPGSKRLLTITLAIMVLVPLVLGLRVPLQGKFGKYEKQNVPYQALNSVLVQSAPSRPALILTDDQQLAGNLRFNNPGIPVIMPGFDGFAEAVVQDPKTPLLVVWRDRGKADPQRTEALKAAMNAMPAAKNPEISGDVSAPYIFGKPGDLYHLGYAWFAETAR